MKKKKVARYIFRHNIIKKHTKLIAFLPTNNDYAETKIKHNTIYNSSKENKMLRHAVNNIHKESVF